MAAGLTIGLVSIDTTDLMIRMRDGTDKDKLHAKKIMPLLKDRHLLLVTLFLFNASANEALPIFLAGLVPEWLSIVLSTSLVLMCGEILPSAIFSGPKQLQIAAFLSPLVWFLICSFYVIAKPIALALDAWLGTEDVEEMPFTERQLFVLIGMHSKRRETMNRLAINPRTAIRTMSKWNTGYDDLERQRSPFVRDNDHSTGVLSVDTATIMQGAMYAHRTHVESIGIPPSEIISLHGDEVMDHEFMEKVLKIGYSRIPVHMGNSERFVGYLITKKLIAVDEHLHRPLHTMPLKKFLYIKPTVTVLQALNLFQEGVAHVALVTSDGKEDGRLLKMITLEDALECVLQEEIQDEKDFSKEQRALLALKKLRNRKHDEMDPSSFFSVDRSTFADRHSLLGDISASPVARATIQMAESDEVPSIHQLTRK